MLSFQSRFSSIEKFTLFIIAVTLYYNYRNKQISKQLDSIRKSMNQEDIEKMTDAEKEKREELGGKLNLSGVISFYLMFGTLPLLILITFIHQIYLFF